jgi:uncharacterized protein
MTNTRSAILVLGRDGPSDETLQTIERFDEVFVVERAVPDPAERYIIDEERAYTDARRRLATVLARLHTDAVEATGMIGDPDPSLAVRDAQAVFPNADEVVAEAEPATAERFEGKYLSLTSFRRDGTGVATPVWFAADDGRLLVETDADSYKVKRIRRDPHVRIALCNARGRPRGKALDAEATILPDGERARVERLLAEKYRIDRLIVYPLYRLATRLRGRGSHTHEPPVTLAITPK